jgi:hypothetical protein
MVKKVTEHKLLDNYGRNLILATVSPGSSLYSAPGHYNYFPNFWLKHSQFACPVCFFQVGDNQAPDGNGGQATNTGDLFLVT